MKKNNDHAAAMFGYDRQTMLSMKAGEPFDGWPEVVATLGAGRRFMDEDVSVRANANRLQVNLSAYPILDTEGRLRDVILVFKDVKKARKLDVRIIVATNKDLEAEVSKGNFRKNLFYRLNVPPMRLPALRERERHSPPHGLLHE